MVSFYNLLNTRKTYAIPFLDIGAPGALVDWNIPNIGRYIMYGKPRSGGYRGGGGGRRDEGPREMHDVTCSDCGCQTQVPFKPTEGRPVYCKDCYAKHKPKRDRY
jgi:CxxC-x17-CxxC domain-containing protein